MQGGEAQVLNFFERDEVVELQRYKMLIIVTLLI
jgi:hypothetical protein